jgi:hypothetical protein
MNLEKELICPLRKGDFGSSRFPTPDKWNKRGIDRVCSYCGSLHPEEFLKLLPLIQEDSEQIYIEISDRRHKIYVRREGIKNAGEGAIKVYLAHVKQWCDDQGMTDEEITELEKQIHSAIIKSNNIFANVIMPKFKKMMKP